MQHLAKISLALTAACALYPAVAQAQLDDRTVVNIMRECRKIADPAARTACYDNIPLGQQAAAASTPGVPPAAPTATGFGSQRLQERAAARAEPNQVTVKVAAVSEREPGMLTLTLEDGAQWQFVDAAPRAYDPPRRGSTVDIQTAALGSYQLLYAGQQSIRVRRVR